MRQDTLYSRLHYSSPHCINPNIDMNPSTISHSMSVSWVTALYVTITYKFVQYHQDILNVASFRTLPAVLGYIMSIII